ncbi:hypothetical protein ACLG6S_00045 [Thermodesulfobacteriota bacterium B35]
MLRHRNLYLPLALFLFFFFFPCQAFSWTDITQLGAGGGAKEVAVNRDVSKVRFICRNAPVIINTVVMREGGKKTPFTMGKRFAVDEEFVLDLGGRHHVTGLRISDDLKGSYLVQVE